MRSLPRAAPAAAGVSPPVVPDQPSAAPVPAALLHARPTIIVPMKVTSPALYSAAYPGDRADWAGRP
ncbi:MAG TPA: hypothetical protein VF951_05535 [Streptosporangiaceae bacterium]